MSPPLKPEEGKDLGILNVYIMVKNKYFLIIFLALSFSLSIFAQGLSDRQVVQTAIELRQSGVSQSDIARQLMRQGATADQLRRLRSEYAGQTDERSLATSPEGMLDSAAGMRVNNAPRRDATQGMILSDSLPTGQSHAGRRVFGRDIFNNPRLSFEPPMNIATPQDYVLGPGDQLVIDIYGASQEKSTLTVSPDGDVTVPSFGPIHVSGLTVAAAQQQISSKLGGYYQSSEIRTTLGQTRTIMVNVMGEVLVPGTYRLSAFATVFHALYMAGGVNDIGTLRNIKVFRQGRQISVVDVYEFILNGRLAGNVTLQDNDVVYVGTYDCIVDLSGKVRRPMSYEMKSSESLAALVKYGGGFTGDAYKKLVRVHRKSEELKSVYNIDEFDMPSFLLSDGDSVAVDSVIDRYKNMVEVKGAVYRPGLYHLGGRVTGVRSLVETASGLTDEAMTSRAVMRRMKPNRTQEVLSVDLQAIMDGTAPDIPLRNEDVLFIPTLAEHQNLRTLTIGGEVIFPGTYEYAEGMGIEDLILQAGGLTDAASTVRIDVSRQIRDASATDAGLDLAQTFSFSLSEGLVAGGDNGFTLQPYDVVQVRRSPVFQNPVRVSVEGEVAFQGSYTMEKKNQRLSDVVEAAGGVIPGSYVRGARLIRKMTSDERERLGRVIEMARQSAGGGDSVSLEQIAMSDTYTVGIHLDEALAHPGSTQDVELMDGDRLIVPRLNHTVRVSGNVNSSNTVAFEEGKDYRYYIEQAGGYGERARKRKAYIVYLNGTMAEARKGKVEPGCEIVVPTKAPADTRNVSQWLGIGTSIASLGTMFATIAHLIK